jgi:hypothetical protein
MEKYKIATLDRAHNAATGIEVGRIEGVTTRRDLAIVTSYDGGTAYMTLKKDPGFQDFITSCVHFREDTALKELAKDYSRAVILIEDMNAMRPCKADEYSHSLDQHFQRSGEIWYHAYSPVCPRCFLDIYIDEERINGLNGFVIHRNCPAADSSGNYNTEQVFFITGFELDKTPSVVAVKYGVYGHDDFVDIGVVRALPSKVKNHMTSNPEKYRYKEALFSCRSVDLKGVMCSPRFVGLIAEEKN